MLYSLEAKLYNEKHTRTILDEERKHIFKKLADVRNINQQMAREIQRNKMFNKKDEERKAKKEHNLKISGIIKDQNKDIEEHDIKLDQERRRLDDRHLLKKQMELTM